MAGGQRLYSYGGLGTPTRLRVGEGSGKCLCYSVDLLRFTRKSEALK